MQNYQKQPKSKGCTTIIMYTGLLLIVVGIAVFALSRTLPRTSAVVVPTAVPETSIRGKLGDPIKGRLVRKGDTFELTVTDKQIVPGKKSPNIIVLKVTLKNTSPAGSSLTGFASGQATKWSDFGLGDADRLYAHSYEDPQDAGSFTGQPLVPGQTMTATLYFEAYMLPTKSLMLSYRGDSTVNAEAIVDL